MKMKPKSVIKRARKSWQEKMDAPGLPKFEPVPERLVAKYGRSKMVIPSPRDVERVMKSVPEGSLITMDLLMKQIAKDYGASVTCPMTCGIFAVITANAADEQANTPDHPDTTPYWRTLKKGGELNPKFPGGVQQQLLMLTCEGHHIARKGDRYFVLDYKEKLVNGQGFDSGSG